MRQSQVALSITRSSKRFLQTIQQQPASVVTPLVYASGNNSQSSSSSISGKQFSAGQSEQQKWTTYSLPRLSKSSKPFTTPSPPPKKITASVPFKLTTSSKPLNSKATSTTPSKTETPAQPTTLKTETPSINKTSEIASTTTATPSSNTAPAPTKKPRRKIKARKAAITLSPAAVSHLRQLLDQPNPQMIRIGVRNRGCSGLTYHLEYVNEPGKFDEEVVQDGVKVLIDSKALFSIIGSEMDWIDDKLSTRFVFHNPNSKGECGCGESFMV